MYGKEEENYYSKRSTISACKFAAAFGVACISITAEHRSIDQVDSESHLKVSESIPLIGLLNIFTVFLRLSN
jgi:hypothetical protein